MRIIYVFQHFGEFAQAESFAFYIRKRGDQNIFITDDPRLIAIAKDDGFEAIESKNTTMTKKIMKRLRPDVLFLCNSKTVFMYKDSILRTKISPGVYTCSLDSNWLFLKDKRNPYKVPEWIDRMYVAMPSEIYKLGLIENGGHYKISKEYKKKILPVGFIPSGNKLNPVKKQQIKRELHIKRNEKLIFFSLGSVEEYGFPKFFPKLKKVVEELQQEGKKVKVLFKTRNRKKQDLKEKWLIQKVWVTTEEYDNYLVSSDLTILHHALGTLPKVIHNQVPAICLALKIKKDLPYYKHSGFYEIEPFRKLDLCYNLSYTISYQELKNSIENLLYNKEEIVKMKKAQEKYFEKGEENVYKDLTRHFQPC